MTFYNEEEIIGFFLFPFVSFKIIVANKSERNRIRLLIEPRTNRSTMPSLKANK